MAHAKSIAASKPTQEEGDDEGEDDPGESPRQGEILLVDDNEMNRDMLCRRLERWGYKVTEAENGQNALETLKTRQFDLILLDVLMPVLNGFDTVKQLKADKATSHIPVIMISAMDEMDSMIRCIKIGAADYISKPINPVLLNARIFSCLEQKRLRDREKEMIQLTIKLLQSKRNQR